MLSSLWGRFRPTSVSCATSSRSCLDNALLSRTSFSRSRLVNAAGRADIETLGYNTTMQRKTQRTTNFAYCELLLRLKYVPLTSLEYTLSHRSMQDIKLAY